MPGLYQRVYYVGAGFGQLNGALALLDKGWSKQVQQHISNPCQMPIVSDRVSAALTVKIAFRFSPLLELLVKRAGAAVAQEVERVGW